MAFSKKQVEYFQNADHRWNIKSGATRSGKTYMDLFVIPKRLRRVSGLEGLNVLLGNTKGTLQRNIIEPLQELWGEKYVGNIRSDNTAILFGEKVYCLGADKINQVDRLRGSSIKYCYGDEVVTWHKDVFDMLKSRLDKEYSRFDGTCNPESPNHWFKKFLDSKEPDIYLQKYTIDDNPFLPLSFKDNLKKEYKGTVYYKRYILGEWAIAEGLIYPIFANNPKEYCISREELPKLKYINIGVDFGGNGSFHSFTASGFTERTDKEYALKSERIDPKGKGVQYLIDRFIAFCAYIEKMYGEIDLVFCDSAEQAIINEMRNKTNYLIRNSIKNKIIDRIRCTDILIGGKRLFLVEDECESLKNALCGAVWNEKNMDDERLDDGSTDIDSLDSFEYSWEWYIRDLLEG